MNPAIAMKRLTRRHNTRYKLEMSKLQPEQKWHILQWRAYRKTWENIMVNISLEDAFAALKSVGAITKSPDSG